MLLNGDDVVSAEITIIQQNDTHGYIEPHPEMFWHHSKPMFRTVGGFARVAGYVRTIKRQKKNVLFVDGTDLPLCKGNNAPFFFSGTVISIGCRSNASDDHEITGRRTY